MLTFPFIFHMPDPGTNSWFFVENPLYILTLLFGYAYFVLGCGPKYMEKRKPYSLKTIIFYYNIFQILSNAIIVRRIYSIWVIDYSFGCEPVRQNLDNQVSKNLSLSFFSFSIVNILYCKYLYHRSISIFILVFFYCIAFVII
jgi:hypothetical protein